MVAAGVSAQADAIRGPSGVLGELLAGSDAGSTIYGQFHGRRSGGSWLFPTLNDPPASVTDAQDEWLEDLLRWLILWTFALM